MINSRTQDNAEVTSHPGDRLPRLSHDPDRSLAELRIEPTSCLWHGTPYSPCLHDLGGTSQLARLRCGRPTVRTHLITIAHPARPPILLATADASRLLPAIITRSLPEPNREIRPDLAYQLVAPRGGGLFAACVRCEVTRDDGGYANTHIGMSVRLSS